MRPRVFVSSVRDGFAEVREAARRGIEAAGGEPVLFEDFPSLPASSRNACLDGVQSCDIYIAIIGARGGWTTPAGKLVVEEEYEEAIRRGLSVLVFLDGNAQRDADAQRLAKKMSDYVDGRFRKTYSDADSLATEVGHALELVVTQERLPQADAGRAVELVQASREVGHDALVRLAIVPERVDELVDPVALESAPLLRTVQEVAHRADVELFDFSRGKSHEVTSKGTLVVRQDGGRGKSTLYSMMELAPNGELAMEGNVTGREDNDDFGASMRIVAADVKAVLRSHFRFALALLNALDPYKRFDSFYYAAGLANVGFRKIVPERKTQSSYGVGTSEKQVILAEPTARRVTRALLAGPDPEIDRIVALFTRHLK